MSSRAAKRRAGRERGEEAARIGRLAEKQLSFWLDQARLTVNRAEVDKEGWDMFVQFPSDNEVSDFMDLDAAKASALVQVKASAAGPHARMTLANALKLARYPGPAFVFAAGMATDQVAEARLVHIGETEIEAILRAAVAARNKRESSLNKIELSLPCPSDCAVPCDGAAIRDALARAIGDDMYRYVATKRAWLDNVGYTDRRKEVRVTWPALQMEQFEALSEFAVGLRKSADAPRVDVFDLRFGERRHQEQLIDVKFELPQLAGTEAVVCVQAPDGERVEVPCEAFSARSVFPFLPREHDRMRLVAKHFELVLAQQRPRGLSLRWSAHFPIVVPPAELDSAAAGAKLFRLLRAGPVMLSLRVQGRETTPHEVGAAWEITEDSGAAERLSALEQLRTIIRVFDLPAPSANVNVELLHEGAADRLRLLALVAEQTDTPISARFPPEALKHPVRLGERAALLTTPWLRIGGVLLIVVTGVVGLVQECPTSPGELEMKASRLPLLVKRIVRQGQSPPKPRELFAEAEQRLEKEGVGQVFIPSDDDDDGRPVPG